MVKAYVDSGHIQKAWELFDMMPERNSYSWNAMISGFLNIGKVAEAVQLFERMPHKHRNAVSWSLAWQRMVLLAGQESSLIGCQRRILQHGMQ
jgi:pentatricopeptide repeat protein